MLKRFLALSLLLAANIFAGNKYDIGSTRVQRQQEFTRPKAKQYSKINRVVKAKELKKF